MEQPGLGIRVQGLGSSLRFPGHLLSSKVCVSRVCELQKCMGAGRTVSPAMVTDKAELHSGSRASRDPVRCLVGKHGWVKGARPDKYLDEIKTAW